MRRIFISHPFKADPLGNIARMTAICRAIDLRGDVAVCPPVQHAWLRDDVPAERDLGMAICRSEIDRSDDVYVFDERGQYSEGRDSEILYARQRGKSVEWMVLTPDGTLVKQEEVAP